MAGFGVPENEVWSSTDGAAWSLEDTNAPFGSRRGSGAASFRGRLWLLGGEASGQGTASDGWYLEGP